MTGAPRGIVGAVAIHQHVAVGVDIGEHPSHYAPFTLRGLAAHHGSRLGRA